MGDTGAETKRKTADDLANELRQEFVDEATETLQALDVALDSARHAHIPEEDLVEQFRRAAITLRGPAANFGFRPLGTLTFRLQDYLAHPPSPLPPRIWDDLQKFIDLMTSIIEDRFPADSTVADAIRGLPCPLGFDPSQVEVHNVDVLLVMPHGAQTHFVERELQQCGYRVSVLSDTIDAFAQVVQTKPNLIIVSAIMPQLDGIDLAIALISMPSTRNIPIAVITSLDEGDERLSLLPGRVPVVHKGAAFADDLFKALDSLFLI